MSAPFQATARLPAVEGTCESCRAPVPRDSRFCSKCGAAVEPNAPGKVSPIESLLAEANLLRVRKDWTTAEERCLDVIRLDPNNVHAHSLLGDLYRDQGRLEHAAQWYQLAVDLDPSGDADRAKLAETEDALAKGLVREASAAPARYPSGTQPLAGLPPSTWLKALWAAFAVFVVAAVVLIAGARARRSNTTTETALRYNGTGAASGATPARRWPGKFMLPAQRETTNRTSRTPLAPPLNIPEAAARAANRESGMSAGAAPVTPGALQAGSADSQISGFTVDPAQRSAAVALSQRGSDSETPDAIRQRTLQNAYRAAGALFGASHSFDRLNVTVRIGANGPAAFSGDIERAAAERLADAGDYSQILALFTNVWWNPAIAPETAGAPGAGGAPGGSTTDSGQ